MEITPEGFIKVEITSEMLARAIEKSEEMGILRNSIRRGQGNVVGFLGEEICLAAFAGSSSLNTYQHDIDYDGLTIEVKSKDRTVDPRLDYDASVANYNTRQEAHFYVFTSIFRDKSTNQYTHGHVIGMCQKSDYVKRARFFRVGDIDPSNNWKVSADCYNLAYAELDRFDSLRDVFAEGTQAA